MLLRLTDRRRDGIPLPTRDEPIIVAQRGRNPDNPSDRNTGAPTVQRLEPNSRGLCNTLTTVAKDNLVCTVSTEVRDSYSLRDIYDALRIRRLSEREYWRLMGWTNKQIDKVVAAGVGKNHMYRQAGNGICVPVLEAIFTKLFKDGRLWN